LYKELLRGKEQISGSGDSLREAVLFMEKMRDLNAIFVTIAISISFFEHPRKVLATGRTKSGKKAGEAVDKKSLVFLPSLTKKVLGREKGFENLNVKGTMNIAIVALQFGSVEHPMIDSWLKKYKSRPFDCKVLGKGETSRIKLEMIENFKHQLTLDDRISSSIKGLRI
jgi:hypothetical protein